MKILHVTNAVGWSGGMEQMRLLLTELEKRNHENVLVCPPDCELIPKLNSKKNRIEILPMFQDYDLIAAWKLNQIVKKHQPDLVHTHHATAHAIALAALSFSKSPPLIVSRRVSFSPRKNPFSRWKYQSGRINKYSVVSQAVKDTLIKGGVDASKIEVVYSAVNPATFSGHRTRQEMMQELKISQDSFVVGKVANYSLWKGQHIFLEAAKNVLLKNPKVVFVLVGKGTENLTEMVQQLGISGSVKLLGFRRDVSEILPIFNISVNSAIEGEGLSGAVRESFFMKVPVVASDVAGNSEIVKDGETGFLAPANDSNALAEKILYVLDHQEESKKMAEKGYEWVMKNATVEKMTDNFLQLYQSVL